MPNGGFVYTHTHLRTHLRTRTHTHACVLARRRVHAWTGRKRLVKSVLAASVPQLTWPDATWETTAESTTLRDLVRTYELVKATCIKNGPADATLSWGGLADGANC
jgi:hypothetical protein